MQPYLRELESTVSFVTEPQDRTIWKRSAVPGFIGFAVGRTTFWDPLVNYRAQKITRDTAVTQIAASYRAWVDLFERAK